MRNLGRPSRSDFVQRIKSKCLDFIRHNYAITNINRWVGQGFGFHDRLVCLSKSMGHSKLESTRYYYSIVPALAQVLDEKTGASSERMIPEVPDYEETN